ncbi:hypothetical protein PPACK8108_LOCUS19670 [Phakopsora pachyrhizi]|uniref:Uncharacterized protein n=1 Tax=Phakopsora pachyrhizi TaxID=170000 RepID=A0AAV0BDB7_PHAPC|nr:hypothetical protein PPACK8108_LOCUS19670 [Phakopsora pachyrhizi]
MVDMEILTMVVTITHMITKPPTMDMANLTILLAMQKVQDQAFITLKIFSPLMDTQDYILNTKILMMSTHQEAHLKAHTCKTIMNTRSQQQLFLLAATASKARKGSLKTLVKRSSLSSYKCPQSEIQSFNERRGSIKTLKKVLMVIKVKRGRLHCRAMRK